MRWLLLLGLVTLAVAKPMAIREFSSNRDSPVMVRLLQQIVAANGTNETEAFQPAARRRRLVVSCPTGEECKLSDEERKLPHGTPCPRRCGATLEVQPVSTVAELKEVLFQRHFKKDYEVCKYCRVVKPKNAQRQKCSACGSSCRFGSRWVSEKDYYCKIMAMNSSWLEKSAEQLFKTLLGGNEREYLQMNELKPLFFQAICHRGAKKVINVAACPEKDKQEALETEFADMTKTGHGHPEGADIFNLIVAIRGMLLFCIMPGSNMCNAGKPQKKEVGKISDYFYELKAKDQLDASAYKICQPRDIAAHRASKLT